MQMGHVKNWAEFQHYKDRSPPWIKLHRGLLDDFNFTSLPLASKALAPLVWLLAAETSDGTVSLDPAWLAWRLRIAIEDVQAGLSPLIERGFLILASKPLARRKQVAIPEGETETETEGEEGRARKGTKPAEQPLGDWIASLNGADAVPAGDPIFGWAEKVGIPADWLALGWWAFESRYLENGKTYTDWRAVFRKALREDWLKLWRPDARSGGWVLTPAGEMAMREKSA